MWNRKGGTIAILMQRNKSTRIDDVFFSTLIPFFLARVESSSIDVLFCLIFALV